MKEYRFKLTPTIAHPWGSVEGPKDIPKGKTPSVIFCTDGLRKFSSVEDTVAALNGQGFEWRFVAIDPWKVEVRVNVESLTFGQCWFLGKCGAFSHTCIESSWSEEYKVYRQLEKADRGYGCYPESGNYLEDFLRCYGAETIRPIEHHGGTPSVVGKGIKFVD